MLGGFDAIRSYVRQGQIPDRVVFRLRNLQWPPTVRQAVLAEEDAHMILG
jgi:hypothetical protein